jgi:hypothetical protein
MSAFSQLVSQKPVMEKSLSLDDLATLFGGTPEDVAAAGKDILAQTKFRYYVPQVEDRDAILLDILRSLDGKALPVAGEARLGDWERGWGENLDDLVKSGFDIAALAPKYLRPGDPIRLFKQIAMPLEPNFVRDYTLLFRNWLFRRYLADAPAVYEFGCGPGAHLAYLADLYPNKKLVGTDWAEASVKILNVLADHYGWNLSGQRFDFFNPDENMELAPGAAVVTFGALEQTGPRWTKFLEWLLARKPGLCVHAEPISELYDTGNLVDYLSNRYHTQRGYLDGFLTMLYRLRDEGRITIDKVHRHQLGTKFCETYSYVVWHPN